MTRDGEHTMNDAERDLQALLGWATAVLGPCHAEAGDGRIHGRSWVVRLAAETGARAYLKRHSEHANWANEAYASEHWAPAFGGLAPRLLAAHAQEPLALLLSEVPGSTMRAVPLSPEQQRAAWHAAGQALVALHALPVAPQFGFCQRDGAPAPTSPARPAAASSEAVAFVRAELDEWTGSARLMRFDAAERRTLAAAHELAAAFAGEPPVACHRDYNPYNWQVAAGGAWSGVIDFEFARRDVRMAEFSRYPDWEWHRQPELPAALLEGYGLTLTARERTQLWVAQVQYAAAAVTWGAENAFDTYAGEGHASLALLAQTRPA